MTKYIFGKDLLSHLEIKPFELFNYVKEGHQPFDQFGKQIPPPDISAKLNQLKELRQELTEFDRKNWPDLPAPGEIKKWPAQVLFGAIAQRERAAPWRESLLNRVENLEKKLTRRGDKYSWAAYELSDDKKSAQRVLDLLQNAFFEIELGIEKDSKKEEPLPQKKETSSNFFTRQGDIWHIGFEGKDTRVKHRSGLQYIALLLERPRDSISCVTLVQAANQAEDPTMTNDRAAEEELNTSTKSRILFKKDEKGAKNAIWRKYFELQGDLEKAESPLEREQIEKERKGLLESLTSENKLADHNRTTSQSNVKKSLDRAYQALKNVGMSEMAKHLKDHIKSNGAYGLTYKDDSTWEITL